MAVLTDYLSRRGEYLVLILVVVASVTLMLLSAGQKDSVARAASDAALSPVQAVISRATSWKDLRAENDSLRAQLASACLEVAAREEAARENQRLEQMVEFREQVGGELVAARVIAAGAARPGHELKLDKGSRDGLAKDMAVITANGLVGKVVAVEPRSSWVRPLLARDCRVSARIARTRTNAIVEWTESGGLGLAFLPYRPDVAIGDEIITSGLGGVFPRGIPIGRVSRTDGAAADGSLRVRVRPAA
ncbi:MAG: rod shape-determining protein MreC, partial [Gemmatimonadetes bacterium]|nr:rod shape-determining protein MreC [Gemmatimonadota bacterium]